MKYSWPYYLFCFVFVAFAVLCLWGAIHNGTRSGMMKRKCVPACAPHPYVGTQGDTCVCDATRVTVDP